MTNDRLCIICNTRKPEAAFETKGEHIVPRSLGNRKLRTPYVCKGCNGGLGGTVDVALKSVLGVMLACYDRDVGGARTNAAHINTDPQPENPDVKGAILKIVYEAAHIRLGNKWLDDPAAIAIRNVLSAYVNKDKETARALMGRAAIHETPAGLFYYSIGKSRSELIKRAIHVKSCFNGLWLALLETERQPLAVFYDIEGLPFGYVVISGSDWGVTEPELLAPKLK